MGKAATHAKDKYNAAAYEDIRVRVPKGEKERIKAYAEQRGESVNGLIWRLLEREMNKANDEVVPGVQKTEREDYRGFPLER